MKPQTAGQFIEAIMTASSQNLTRKDPAIRKSYISERTWELIKQKQDAREKGDYASELSLRKEAKKTARQDKLAFDDKQFRELQGTKEGWGDLKFKWKPFVPNHSKLEDRHGKIVPYGQTANAIADYLANEQWAKPERRERPIRPPILAPGAA